VSAETKFADIDRRFDYHAPDADKVRRHENVRGDVKVTARVFELNLPDGREKSLAITKLEEALFWANAAIARN
jgi:hypothetical protein